MWYGENGMENVRTLKEPKQSIPTFAETVTLLMLVRLLSYLVLPFPLQNLHVVFTAGKPARQVQR